MACKIPFNDEFFWWFEDRWLTQVNGENSAVKLLWDDYVADKW